LLPSWSSSRVFPPHEGPAGSKWERIHTSELAVQSHLLIDIMGNRFLPVSVDSSWLTPVVKQAKAMYRKLVFNCLHILSNTQIKSGLYKRLMPGHSQRRIGELLQPRPQHRPRSQRREVNE
jgi:hypothetical protein